jgi:hypothetical protein
LTKIPSNWISDRLTTSDFWLKKNLTWQILGAFRGLNIKIPCIEIMAIQSQSLWLILNLWVRDYDSAAGFSLKCYVAVPSISLGGLVAWKFDESILVLILTLMEKYSMGAHVEKNRVTSSSVVEYDSPETNTVLNLESRSASAGLVL